MAEIMTAKEILDEINARVPKSALPSGKEVTLQSLMMKIKRAGIMPAKIKWKKKLYNVDDIISLYGGGKEVAKRAKATKISTKEIAEDASNIIDGAGTVEEAWEEWKRKIEDRTMGAASAKIEAEIEKIMLDSFNKELDIKEKIGTLLTKDEILSTLGYILSNLKKEITQIPGQIAAIAPELSREKLARVEEQINISLQKVADEFSK